MPKVTSHSVPRKNENLLGTWDTSSSILACDCCHIRPGVMFQAVPRQLGSLPRQMVCAGRGSPSRFYGLRAPRRPHCPTGGPLNVRPGRFGRVHLSPLNHVFSSFFIEQVELFWTFVFSFLEVPKDDATWWVFKCFSVTIAVQVEMFPWKLDMLVARVFAGPWELCYHYGHLKAWLFAHQEQGMLGD